MGDLREAEIQNNGPVQNIGPVVCYKSTTLATPT